MSETESHSPSLSKRIKKLLSVFHGAAKKKKKENSAFLKHYGRPIAEKQGQHTGENPGEGSPDSWAKAP